MTFQEAMEQAASKPGELFARPVLKTQADAERWRGTGYFFRPYSNVRPEDVLWIKSPLGAPDEHALIRIGMVKHKRWELATLQALDAEMKGHKPVNYADSPAYVGF